MCWPIYVILLRENSIYYLFMCVRLQLSCSRELEECMVVRPFGYLPLYWPFYRWLRSQSCFTVLGFVFYVDTWCMEIWICVIIDWLLLNLNLRIRGCFFLFESFDVVDGPAEDLYGIFINRVRRERPSEFLDNIRGWVTNSILEMRVQASY